MTEQNRFLGLACAIGAQLCWGAFPLYVHLLRSVDSVDFVAHRIVWAFSFLAICVYISRFVSQPLLPSWKEAKGLVKNGEVCGSLCLAAIMILINWLTFVWAVNHDHKVDASLGYYICPHVVVLLGVVFLRERLNLTQWIAVALTAVGVVLMARSATSLPLIAIAIALSFAMYAMVKKKVAASPLGGLLIETGFLLLPAMTYLYFRWPADGLLLEPWWANVLLVGSGLATIVPLALYATGIKHIRLTTMGQLQYLAPTIQFLIGVLIFNEAFDWNRIIGFIFVWIGVILFMFALLSLRPTKIETVDGDAENVNDG
jgi:chloramphenicol-sensitive protein RarD